MVNKRRVNVFNIGSNHPELNYSGVFHGWGVDHKATGQNSGSFTCAIVERDDGSVKLVHANNVEFVKEKKEKD